MVLTAHVVDAEIPNSNKKIPPVTAKLKFKNRKLTIENGLKMLRVLISDYKVGLTEIRASLDVIIHGLPKTVNGDKTVSRQRFVDCYNNAYHGKRGNTWLNIANAIMCLIAEFPIDRTLARTVVKYIGMIIKPRPLIKQNEFWHKQLSTKFSTSKYADAITTSE